MSRKAYEQLKQELVADMRRKKDEEFVIIGRNKYTRHQMADEIEKETAVGKSTLKNLILLSIDLVTRKKEVLP